MLRQSLTLLPHVPLLPHRHVAAFPCAEFGGLVPTLRPRTAKIRGQRAAVAGQTWGEALEQARRDSGSSSPPHAAARAHEVRAYTADTLFSGGSTACKAVHHRSIGTAFGLGTSAFAVS